VDSEGWRAMGSVPMLLGPRGGDMSRKGLADAESVFGIYP
jgi:hypothetical protein